jgi:hypothetical protein
MCLRRKLCESLRYFWADAGVAFDLIVVTVFHIILRLLVLLVWE